MKTKEFNVAIIFIITSLIAYGYFPAVGMFQQTVAILVFFLLLPLLFNKIILKKELKLFDGWLGDYKQGVLWSLYSLCAVGLIFFVAAYYFGFLDNYTVPAFIVGDFKNFLFYEFIILVPFVALYEFYFRGFLMPIFKEKIGYWAVLGQAAVLFFFVLATGGGNFIQFVPYLVFAPFAGVIAYKSNSILYSGIVQFVILFILNVIVIKNIA